jgi:hypothetical protein
MDDYVSDQPPCQTQFTWAKIAKVALFNEILVV